MYSFKQFVTESSRERLFDFDDAITHIQNESPNVVNVLCKTGQLLYRGMSKRSHFVGVGENRTDRKAKDSSIRFTTLVDDKLFEKFGVRGRTQATFCVSNRSVAKFYGDVYIVVPYDGLKFVWSPVINDLYTVQTGHNAKARAKMEEIWAKVKAKAKGSITESQNDPLFDNIVANSLVRQDDSPLEELVDWVVSTYQDTDLEAAIRSGHEIMFQGKYTYLDYSRLASEYKFSNIRTDLLKTFMGDADINDFYNDGYDVGRYDDADERYDYY